MIKNIIFGLNNVLVDMGDFHYTSLNEVLRDVSKYEIPRYRYETEFRGIPTRNTIDQLVRDGLVCHEHRRKVYELKQQKTIEFILNIKPESLSQVQDAVQSLYNSDYSLCCITNMSRSTAFEVLNKTNLWNYFNFLISNEDTPHHKPDSTPYILALNRLRGNIDETLVFENSACGLKAARSLGLKSYLVEGPWELTTNFTKDSIDYAESLQSKTI